MFVLDTNVISELRQGKPSQSSEVRAWAAAQPASRLFLSAITILELEKGVQALERRTPPHGSALRAWLAGVRAEVAMPPSRNFCALVSLAFMLEAVCQQTRRHRRRVLAGRRRSGGRHQTGDLRSHPGGVRAVGYYSGSGGGRDRRSDAGDCSGKLDARKIRW